ncbi:MAG: ester cyclase [Candidatus Poribacteria bacterium]|nr:ester cyclase [Candidatus Poribacteria bacterium]
MSKLKHVAEQFFTACEDGEGWDVCKKFCHADATFSAQAPAIAGITTVEGYTDWLKGLYTFVTDTRYEIQSFGVDEGRNNVTVFSVFHGTHTGEGGPLPATGKSAATEYCYCLQFEDGRLRHMTKIWNDGVALQQLGWV